MIDLNHLTVRSVGGATIAQSIALTAPVVATVLSAPERMVVLLAASLFTAVAWEVLFANLRDHGFSFHNLTTALIVTVVLPPEVAVWQVVLVVSLGVILGDLVFGGRGFGFVQPATVVVSLFLLSFPGVQLPTSSTALAIATLPGLLILLALGLISWRVIVAAGVAVALTYVMQGRGVEPVDVATALVFGLVFLICDPVSAASTNLGRWVYGALAGVLVAVFAPIGVPNSEAIVFAALMSSVFAPLIDHFAVLIHARRRARRHA